MAIWTYEDTQLWWATLTETVLFGTLCVLETMSSVHFQDSSSNLDCIFHGLIQELSVA